jgi:hypothetical protein
VIGTALADSELGPAGSPVNNDQWGVYHDELRRFDEGWRFTHRTFVPLYVSPGSLPGQVMAPRTSLADLGRPRVPEA